MKKPFLLSILFLSLFSLGTKATTIYGTTGTHMKVITKGEKDWVYFESENNDILFGADQGVIAISTTPDTNENYKKIKNMKNDITSKIPASVNSSPTLSSGCTIDSEGIVHWVGQNGDGNKTEGYAVLFDFVPSDIDKIYLYYGQGNNKANSIIKKLMK